MEKENIVEEQNTQNTAQDENSVNIAEMSEEEIAQAVEDGTLTVEDVKSYSEELEAQHKTSKQLDDKSRQILRDRIAKIAKLRNKAQSTKHDVSKVDQEEESIDPDDLITLRLQGFDKDSEEAKVLKQFKDAGLIKDYQSGLEDVAVKAKLEAIKAEREAANQVDMSDDEMLKASRKEILNEYETTGNVPESKEEQRKLAEDNLEKMGL